MIGPIEEVASTLRRVSLPPLTRPDLGPDDAPTLELVQFDLKAYCYSSTAYVRDLLNGLILLGDAHNVAATDFVVRGLYEWTMQASFVDQQSRAPIKSADYVKCRAVMDRIQSGNSWVKKHGDKYWKPPFEGEMLDTVRIKHLVKAYKTHQLEHRNEETVEDEYGYLSEHAHPNSFCFLDVTERHGRVLEFVTPTFGRRDRGIAPAIVVDWSLCIYNILCLADENAVKGEFVKMLERIAGESQGPQR